MKQSQSMSPSHSFSTLTFVGALILLFHLCYPTAKAEPGRLDTSRDSLITLLHQTKPSDGSRRLQILNHLCDIGFCLGDSTYIYTCWNEAIRQKEAATIEDMAVPLTLSYLNKGQLDSAEVWTNRCKTYLSGSKRQANLEYIQLMNDIRRYDEYEHLAKQLIQEQINLDVAHEPFRAMRILYTLGIISNFGHANNTKLTLKPGLEYFCEALNISQKLPFRESARFQRQLLLALSCEKLTYARQYLTFVNRFLQEPDIKARPFYSRRSLISAYEKMILQGSSLPREELDGYYASILDLVQKFPHNTPMPLDYYIPRVQYYYNDAIGNQREALRWCDSLIAVARKYHIDPCYFYEYKVHHLGALEQWKEGYYSALNLMQIQDSIANASNEKKLSELQTQYEVDSYKRETIAYRTQSLLTFIVAFLLFLILILAIFYSRRLKAKNKILLGQLESYTLNLKKEKQERMQAQSKSPDTETAVQTSSPILETTQEKENAPASESNQESVLFCKLDELMRTEKLYLQADINRDTLVERLGTNKNKLSEAIATATNSNLSDYIMELRLQEALLLMEADTEISLTEIAEQAGFNVYSSFYRSFSKQFGVKPTEYRKFLKK